MIILSFKTVRYQNKKMEQTLIENVKNQLNIGRWTPTVLIATRLNMSMEDVNRILFALEKEDKSVMRNHHDSRSLKNNYTWIRIQGKIR